MFFTSALYKGGKPFLTLKQFIVRGEVLGMYRKMLREVYKVKDKTHRDQLLQYVRAEFEINKHHTEEDAIKGHLMQAQRHLRELEQTIDLANA